MLDLFFYPNYCLSCLREILPVLQIFTFHRIEVFTLYEYDEKMQSLIYQLKGCYDIEISDVFLCRYYRELSLYFFDYYMVPIPSYHEDDEQREFNHVEEIFKYLKLPMIKVLEKCAVFKQASHHKKERSEIAKFIRFIGKTEQIKNKKILIVDDVFTTGSTLKACIDLINQHHPKCVKALIISKTINKQK